MKKIRIIGALILALTLNISFVLAQNMNMRSTMPNDSSARSGIMKGQSRMGMMAQMSQNGMMKMMNMMQGRMQNMMNNPLHRMMLSVYTLPSLDTLGLSTTQKSELGTLKSNYLKKRQDSNAKIIDLQNKLSKELASESLNLKNIHNLINQKSEHQGNWQWVIIDTYHNMMGALTKVQQKQFRAMNAQSFMNAMMNSIPMSQMMALCQTMRSSGRGMMNGMMGGGMMNGMMGGGMMNGPAGNKMMNQKSQ